MSEDLKDLEEAVKKMKATLGVDDITPEMEALFNERTRKHVRFVQHYAKILDRAFPELAGLKIAAAQHDASKWSSEEKPGYILTTWSYKKTGKGSKDPAMKAAWEHHQKSNLNGI